MINEIFNSEITKAVHSCLTINDDEAGLTYEGHVITDQNVLWDEIKPEVIDAILKDKNFIESLKDIEPTGKLPNEPYDSLEIEVWDYLSGELGIGFVDAYEYENGEYEI